MFPDETRSRQEKLSKEIYGLAGKILDKEACEHLTVIKRLQKIYADGFKHSYSDLFPVILKIFEENNKYNKEYLTANLEIIRDELESDDLYTDEAYEKVYNSFIKLCDHLNLQISEMSVFSRTEDKVNDAKALIVEANKNFQSASVALKEANEKAKSLQTELIAVLSIFAAIVIAFSGGFTFLGSVMTSIKGVTYFESVILAAVICGLVIFNTIFLMMYLVSKITERNIYARCLTKDCSCESEGAKCKCNGIKRIQKRLPYVFYYNVVSVIIIIIDMVIWFLDIKNIII